LIFPVEITVKACYSEADEQSMGCRIYKGSAAIMQEINKLDRKNNGMVFTLPSVFIHQSQ
jgi:hypothetical protein